MQINSTWKRLASTLFMTICGFVLNGSAISVNATLATTNEPAIQEKKQTLNETELKQEKLLARKLAGDAAQAFADGKYDSALTAATQLCELRPDVIDYQFLRGNISFAAGKMAQSIASPNDLRKASSSLKRTKQLTRRTWRMRFGICFARPEFPMWTKLEKS